MLLEAWDPVNEYWIHIQYDFSDDGPTPYHFGGADWYVWQVNNLSIPRKYWSGQGALSCRLRATVDGRAIGTFTDWHTGIANSETLSELWTGYGAGDELTIYAWEKQFKKAALKDYSIKPIK